MWKKLLRTTLIAALVLSSCTDNDVYKGPKEDEKEFNNFPFSTVQKDVNLNVNYVNGTVQSNVYFEVYDEMPVTESEYGTYIKRQDVDYLFAAYTKEDGTYKGKIELPSYLTKVYIYSPAFFAQTLMEANIVNGNIEATDNSATETRTITSTKESHDSYLVSNKNGNEVWKTWLGDYDMYKNGDINYKYNGTLAATKKDGLYTAHTRIINTHNTCPQEYRGYSDMYVNKDAEVVVTFLGQNTCWTCSLGYYYYKEGEQPADLNEAHVIMLFPNTQDGNWSNNLNLAKKSAGIDPLTAVQLMYYPNIASGSKEGATTAFPKGYRIGFVLATNGWNNHVGGFTGYKKSRAATSSGLSLNADGVNFNEPRTAVYRYGDWILTSFEDYMTDENFSDVVITLKSNPVDAITDIPVTNPDDDKTSIDFLKGIYAFEDLWPNQGDYDMNDVVVRYNYGNTFNEKNQIYSESFTFKTFQNVATNKNGLAFRLLTKGNIKSTTYSIRKEGEKDFAETTFTYEPQENIYLLTENVKDNMGAEYKVTVNYSDPISTQSEAQAFIFKNEEDGLRWEMHVPLEVPTSKMNKDYFGQGDDASQISQSIYYVRKGNYPFAFFLSRATESDLSKLLDSANERKAINLLYSGYDEWVTSNGEKNKDWYKK
jgi:LruC domain-containing protein